MRAPLPALLALLVAAPVLAGPAPQVAVAWDVLAPVPLARTEVAAVAAGGEVWVLGGLLASGGTTRVDVYNPATGAWRTGPALPVALHHTQVVALGTRILVLGGYTGNTFQPTAATWLLESALPRELQAWLPFVPLPAPRGAHGAATDGARVWVFGGATTGGVLDPTVFRLEGAAGLALPAWLPGANFPEPRDHLAGAFLDGKVYAAGGRKLSLATNTARLDIYDPAADAWTRGADMPTRRGGIAAAAAGGLLFVFGGEAPGGVTFAAAEAYDPATGRWTSAAPMPHARHGLGAAAMGNAVYVEAGGPVAGLTVSAHNERMRVL